MMLQLKVSHSQGWPEKDFKDAAKQGNQAQNPADNLVYQIALSSLCSSLVTNLSS